MITEFKGQNGKIKVFNDHVAISRDTFGGFISQGGYSGERKLFYADISSIEYRKPTFWANGYIKFIVPGTNDTNAKVGILGSSFASMKDQNTIVLRAFTSKVGDETDKLYKILIDKLAEVKTQERITSPVPSKMDELKKLGELKASGVLTEEEFQKEKGKLLNDEG